MGDDAEILHLRTEIERLLLAALESELSHAVEIEQMATEASEAESLRADEAARFRAALASRDVIGQAKGVIMATMGCSADDAFKLLVTQSQHENRKLTEIAAEVAGRASRGR